MSDLASMPSGTHIGQLDTSFIKHELPAQFLMQYDYDFLYQMRCTIHHLRLRAKMNQPMVAHSIMEELLIYLCNEEAKALMELSDEIEECYDEDWIFDLFDDKDIITFLYSNIYLDSEDAFHINYWNDKQFYVD